MGKSGMKYFLFSSTLMLLAACASEYRTLTPTSQYNACFDKLKPREIPASWFDASVEVEGHHLGGLILIKRMPDQSNRVVFTSETGATIFDFEFQSNGAFNIRHIVSKLNRKAIVNVLRNDFALLLGVPFRHNKFETFEGSDGEIYLESRVGKRRDFIISDKNCQLLRLEEGSKRKRLFSILINGTDSTRPDNITINHHTFDMVIVLKRIEKNVAQ
jgi:hypothetical protein